NQSDAITAVSHNLREETYKYFKIKKDIQVIYNFVDIQRFDKKPIDAFKKAVAPKGEKIMVHASNFRKVKRVCDVIEIFAATHKEVPCKLLMVGDGPERPVCEETINRLGLENEVRFMGKQEQMEEILAISDLFILPSEYESFGLAALEAMAAHVPVLSSNAGGLPEVNIDGETGFLFEIGDVDSAAKKAIELFKNDTLLAEFKERAYQQALKFNINNIIPIYEKLYNKFCRRNCQED
ncbi:MAG TPA: N-acetyl-alpha-D-glucosaminyl L-malate synthase BshA, partial [Arachidicoccus sp.]|nr:N-acetyl-alpha-D-glucosaminyl L-malate synthase BshA [Arachidicoccus sp.]